MFTYKTKIHLKATDATGVLYFSEQFRMALDALQEYLASRGLPLKKLLESEYLMPIVHAEGDYLAPLEVDDEVDITLKLEKIGTSSFTVGYTFFDPKRQLEVGKVLLVHVTVLRATRRSVPIPDSILAALQAVPAFQE